MKHLIKLLFASVLFISACNNTPTIKKYECGNCLYIDSAFVDSLRISPPIIPNSCRLSVDSSKIAWGIPYKYTNTIANNNQTHYLLVSAMALDDCNNSMWANHAVIYKGYAIPTFRDLQKTFIKDFRCHNVVIMGMFKFDNKKEYDFFYHQKSLYSGRYNKDCCGNYILKSLPAPKLQSDSETKIRFIGATIRDTTINITSIKPL